MSGRDAMQSLVPRKVIPAIVFPICVVPNSSRYIQDCQYAQANAEKHQQRQKPVYATSDSRAKYIYLPNVAPGPLTSPRSGQKQERLSIPSRTRSFVSALDC